MLDLSGIIILDQIFYKSSLKVCSKSFILKKINKRSKNFNFGYF